MSTPDTAALIASDAAALAAEHPIVEGRITPKRLFSGDEVRVMLLAFGAGQELTEHKAPVAILLQTIDGSFEIEMGGDRPESFTLGAGGTLHVPAALPHAVRAEQPSRLLITMLGRAPHAADQVEG